MSPVKPVALLLSDFHIGEKLGSVRRSPAAGYVELAAQTYVRQEFTAFLDNLRKHYGVSPAERVKYLIIMGDQWDLAVQPLPEAFNLALDFFNAAGLQDYCAEIIYLPGNHDHHLWRMYQTRYCATAPLEACKPAVAQYPQLTNGLLDLTGVTPKLTVQNLDGYDPNASFLGGLTGRAALPVHIVYPNLSIVYNGTDGHKRAALCTHGHLFDAGWNVITDAIYKVTGKLPSGQGVRFDLHDIEMLNSPLTEFWNYSLSQTGKYDLIDNVYDLYLKLSGLLAGLVKRLVASSLGELLAYHPTLQASRARFDKLSETRMARLMDDGVAETLEEMHRVAGFFHHKRQEQEARESHFLELNRERVVHYLAESLKPLQAAYGLDHFSQLIYGHTHKPENATSFRPHKESEAITVYNTGGWVHIDEKDYPQLFLLMPGGEVQALAD